MSRGRILFLVEGLKAIKRCCFVVNGIDQAINCDGDTKTQKSITDCSLHLKVNNALIYSLLIWYYCVKKASFGKSMMLKHNMKSVTVSHKIGLVLQQLSEKSDDINCVSSLNRVHLFFICILQQSQR